MLYPSKLICRKVLGGRAGLIIFRLEGSLLNPFQFALTTHPSPSGSGRQSFFEQIPKIEHSSESLGNLASGLIDKRFNNSESADSQGNNNQ